MYLELIARNYNRLSKSEKKVADKITNNQINIYQDSIFEAAKIAGVSASLINKFCIKIGVSGWKTLKGIGFLSLTQKREESFFGYEFNIINNLIDELKHDLDNKINLLHQKITKANQVIIFANGNTKMIAKIFAAKMRQLNLRIDVFDYTTSIVLINEDIFPIFISISGDNKKYQYYLAFKKLNRKNSCYITFNEKDYDFHGLQINLGVYNIFSATEKAFPLASDVFLLALLNQIVKLQFDAKKELFEKLDTNKKYY